jgi:uncharacterized protein (DUF1786 family)
LASYEGAFLLFVKVLAKLEHHTIELKHHRLKDTLERFACPATAARPHCLSRSLV